MKIPTIQDELAALKELRRHTAWRARNPRSDARAASEAEAELVDLDQKIADLRAKIEAHENPLGLS